MELFKNKINSSFSEELIKITATCIDPEYIIDSERNIIYDDFRCTNDDESCLEKEYASE